MQLSNKLSMFSLEMPFSVLLTENEFTKAECYDCIVSCCSPVLLFQAVELKLTFPKPILTACLFYWPGTLKSNRYYFKL